jgi:hypothetical protein
VALMDGRSDFDVAAEIQTRWPDVAGVVAVRKGVLAAQTAPEHGEDDASQARLAVAQAQYHVVYPTLLTLTSGRGNLDMGGPPYFLILRGRCRGEVLFALRDGHLALWLRSGEGLATLATEVLAYLRGVALVSAGQSGPLSSDYPARAMVVPTDRETRWYDWYRSGTSSDTYADVLRACRSIDLAVRYVALVDRGALVGMCSRMGPVSESSEMAASDRFEETVVNPAALALTAGAARMGAWSETPALIVRYPGLYAVVIPTQTGHITFSVDRGADPVPVADRAMAWVASAMDAAKTSAP